uniref:Uncharacterized protein n=1 Tax=Cacopsylla melanoneura TaxID=428564 RepID=A0A8D8M612_9HEMI
MLEIIIGHYSALRTVFLTVRIQVVYDDACHAQSELFLHVPRCRHGRFGRIRGRRLNLRRRRRRRYLRLDAGRTAAAPMRFNRNPRRRSTDRGVRRAARRLFLLRLPQLLSRRFPLEVLPFLGRLQLLLRVLDFSFPFAGALFFKFLNGANNILGHQSFSFSLPGGRSLYSTGRGVVYFFTIRRKGRSQRGSTAFFVFHSQRRVLVFITRLRRTISCRNRHVPRLTTGSRRLETASIFSLQVPE